MEESLLPALSKHVVILGGWAERFVDGKVTKEGQFLFPGVILEMHGIWLWATAGHCLKENLDEQIEAVSLKIVSCGFADWFGADATHMFPIPFAYTPGCGYYIDDASAGLDFGLIVIPSLTRKGFEANGIFPVPRSHWLEQDGLNFDHYKIVGCPSEMIQGTETRDGVDQTRFKNVIIAVERLQPSEVSGDVADSWFVGRIREDVPHFDIAGMSGGPIFGFRTDEQGQWRYYLVALQSSWRESTRIVFGCSLRYFAEAVHNALQVLFEEVAKMDVTDN